MKNQSDSPGVIVFPPVLYGGTLLSGLLLHCLFPMSLHAPVWLRIAGFVLTAPSGFTAQWAARTMKRAGTNVLPSKPTLTIVTGAPSASRAIRSI